MRLDGTFYALDDSTISQFYESAVPMVLNTSQLLKAINEIKLRTV